MVRAGENDRVETVDYEELPKSPSPGAPSPVDAAGAGADTGRIDEMAEPDEVREPVALSAAETQASDPPRRGGFWTGLIGGLLGGAAIAGGGGWWAVEHGPIKPALERLDTTEAATRTAESGIATSGGKLDELGSSVGGKIEALDTSIGGLGSELGTTKSALQQADGAIAALSEKLAGAEAATTELGGKVEQADRAFRAAADQVTARLEAVDAKLVEVEQGQPADIVDKQTVSDIAAKQSSVEQGQQSIAAGLARFEQLVTQSLEAGNKQATALQTMVEGAHSRMEEIAAQQRDLLAMKSELGDQAKVNQEQASALSATTAQLDAIRGELQEKVQGAHRTAAAAGGHQHAPDDRRCCARAQARPSPLPPTASTRRCRTGSRSCRPSTPCVSSPRAMRW